MEVKRKKYLEKLDGYRDKKLIKVVTGIRRCGKSTLLLQYREQLLESGIKKEQIQTYNFEDVDMPSDYKTIHEIIKKKLIAEKMNYIFLDEVQYIENFERLLVGLQTKENVDLYVTGSNAHMLSSEMATLLSGRAIEITMLPFSFMEYLEATMDSEKSREQKFNDYLSFGGFPQAVSIFEANSDDVDLYLSSIYDTIVGRDILTREDSISRTTLDKVVRYLLDNIGSSTSINSIAEQLGLTRYKVEQIVEALKASFLFYRLDRLDVKGKEILKTQEKYYAVDMGMRWSILGRDANMDKGHILENIIYLELLRRGAKVSVGKVGEKEVDFVVRGTDGYISYYQVAWSVANEETMAREMTPFRKIQDFNQRFILTMDAGEWAVDGVRVMNIIDWLTEK